MKPYRTLFTGTLVQDSALSVGGSSIGAGTVDDPLCRDGKNRLTLRGSTLAGALVATLRKLVPHLPKEISAGAKPDKDTPAPPPSLWQVFTTHPQAEHLETRQGVGIRQDTGAAAKGVLFDLETLPRGTRWNFVMEVNTHADKEDEAERLAAAALLEWRRGRCWLGRSVARGLGWLHLENLCAWRLNTSHIDLWPDSRLKLDAAIDQVQKTSSIRCIEAGNFKDVFAPLPVGDWRYLEIEGTIQVGERDNGYGVDALSVGGHAANLGLTTYNSHYLKPCGQALQKRKDNFIPDAAIVLTQKVDGELEPFLPGSGLRGPLRHALSRWLRAQGKTIRDPNVRDVPTDKQDDSAAVEDWFGNFERSARLLVRDAYLQEGSEWRAAWLQHHAEDEFAGGVYGSSKFDRVALMQAEFEWKLVFELDPKYTQEVVLEAFRPVLRLAENSHLPVGGGQWRGVGWPRWQVKQIRLGWAGEDTHEQQG